MESQELLHPNTDENQNQEVNPGTSMEGQTVENTDANNATEAVAEPAAVVENAELATPQAEETPAEPVVEPATEVVAPQVETTPAELETVAETPVAEEPAAPQVEETPAEPVASAPVAETPAASETAEQSVSEMMNEIENTQAPETENEDEGETVTETMEDVEKQYEGLDFDQTVGELERVTSELDYDSMKMHVSVLKAKGLELLKAARKALYDKFIADGGNKEDFEVEPTEIEKKFNAALQLFKDKKAAYLEKIEKEKQKNLEEKKSIIEGLRELVESETNLKVLNDKFKELQDKWKEIGPVPQSESNNLWQNYHFYVEKFFDIRRINKELRSLDLKKNLEQKIKLCETAESLLLQDSVNQSFKALQQLHEEWKEIGPVPEDKKDEIWERFKNASDQINQARREYYDKLFEEQQNNYNAKVVLCEQAEELTAGKTVESVKENNEIADKLTELLKMWKTIGPAPVKLNDEVWERFKSTLDKFFTAKKEYFQQVKDEQMQNYNQKLNLAIQAEGIAERTDWKNATDEILNLQQEWKAIGTVPRKYSEQVWKRFRAACDKFFAAKAEYFSNIKEIEAENLKKKEELIEKILTHEFGDDRAANLDVIKDYQRQWTEIGFVPKKDKDRIYTAYREALDKRFAELKMNSDDVRRSSFRNKIDNILSNPNADRLLDKEKKFLATKLQQLRDDINLWENNLGFFANSKNADLLKQEFAKKVENAKKEVKELEYKLKMMSAPKKEEEPKQEENPQAEEPAVEA